MAIQTATLLEDLFVRSQERARSDVSWEDDQEQVDKRERDRFALEAERRALELYLTRG